MFADQYRAKTEDELRQIASQKSTLTSEAWLALSAELATRSITVQSDPAVVQADDSSDSRTAKSLRHLNTGDFIAEVLRFYHRNRWTFMKLVFPAVVVGTVAVVAGRHESHEISRHLYRENGVVRLQVGILEIGILTWGSFLVSWMAFCFAFGAICAAVEQVRSGFVASVPDSFATVRERLGPFLRLSVFLWLGLLSLVIIATLAASSILDLIHSHFGHPSSLTIYVISYGLFGLITFVLSRFSLAIPALLLDDLRLWRAIVYSYELTRSNWPILIVLLFKSIVGGYVAGMLPFWLARFIPANVNLPWWFGWSLTIASVCAVTVIEPVMFIGFALLYLKTSEQSPPEPKQLVISA